MTMLFADGFDWGSGDADLVLKGWSEGNPTFQTTGGRFGGGSLGAAGSNRWIQRDFASTVTVIVGFSLKVASIASSNAFVTLYDSAGGIQIQLRFNTSNDGRIDILRGTTVIATSTNTMAVDTWYWVELKATIDDASGAAELKVDETTWASFAGDTQETANTNVGKFRYASPSTNAVLDDILIMDDSGSTNNDFIGDTRIYTIRPESDVENDFTPSAGGDNFAMVDDPDVDGDSTYVESSTLGHRDRFGVGNLPVAPDSIYAVAHNIVARKDDAGSRELQGFVELSATEVSGTSVAIAGNYANQQDIHETKPGGGAWTGSDVDSMTVGYEVSV